MLLVETKTDFIPSWNTLVKIILAYSCMTDTKSDSRSNKLVITSPFSESKQDKTAGKASEAAFGLYFNHLITIIIDSDRTAPLGDSKSPYKLCETLSSNWGRLEQSWSISCRAMKQSDVCRVCLNCDQRSGYVSGTGGLTAPTRISEGVSWSETGSDTLERSGRTLGWTNWISLKNNK